MSMTADERANELAQRIPFKTGEDREWARDLIAAAIRAAEREALERAAGIAKQCRIERGKQAAQFTPPDERAVWVECKASEAARIESAIRALIPADEETTR